MAATSETGSGRFVQTQEWTCSQHDHPQDHYCDCEHCDREWDCDECATAEWKKLLNEDGTPQMRELGVWEAMMIGVYAKPLMPQRIEWLDDEFRPRIT